MNALRPWHRRMFPVVVVGTLVLSACVTTPGQADRSETEAAGGTVIVSGSSTVEPITSLVAEDYSAEAGGFDFQVDGPGTGDGFALFCGGETDISDASRTIKDEEAATCADNGIDYVELKIGIDGISVVTSTANDAVSCLSFIDLYALLGPESQGLDNWSEAASLADELAAELGDEFGTANTPYPDATLEVTAPGEESGTYDSFVELVFDKIAEARGTDAVARADYTASAEDNVIVEGISGTDTSLGWVGFSFFEQNTDVITALEIDGGEGCVAPTTETIASNEYPVSRDLYIYVNTDRAARNPAVAGFVDFYLSDAGIALVEEAGYVRLTADALDETRATWEGR